MLRERPLDVVERPVRADAAPASDRREPSLGVLSGERPVLEHDRLPCVAPLESRPSGGRRHGVPTFSPIVKWRSWPSTRGSRTPGGKPELREARIGVDVDGAPRAPLELALRTSPPWLTKQLGFGQRRQRRRRSAARRGSRRRLRSAPRSAVEAEARDDAVSNQGTLRQADVPPRRRRRASYAVRSRDSWSTQTTS